MKVLSPLNSLRLLADECCPQRIGVVLLDFGHAPGETRLARTLSVVGELGDLLSGHLTVIYLKRHRRRSLPD